MLFFFFQEYGKSFIFVRKVISIETELFSLHFFWYELRFSFEIVSAISLLHIVRYERQFSTLEELKLYSGEKTLFVSLFVHSAHKTSLQTSYCCLFSTCRTFLSILLFNFEMCVRFFLVRFHIRCAFGKFFAKNCQKHVVGIKAGKITQLWFVLWKCVCSWFLM